MVGMGREAMDRIREKLGEGRVEVRWGNRLGESGIRIVRGIGWILEREKRVGEMG
jgi:hypothetical protein